MNRCLASVVGLPLLLGGLTANGEAGRAEAPPAPPAPAITLGERDARVKPRRAGFQHTAAGVIDMAQPAPDTVVITMTGVAVAGAHPCKASVAAQDFDLEQCFEVLLDKPEGRGLKLAVEARVVGLLRSHWGGGVAEESAACASVSCGPAEVVTVCAPPHSVSGHANLSINDHAGPVTVALVPGKYTLHQTFHVAVHHPCNVIPHKAASAEFAPEPALDPLWISHWEPFHGAVKKDFGFQVTLKVSAE
jgi:hypothetical protein